MVENPWRRFALIVFLVAAGAWFLTTNGFRLGLDLQGGTRLVYRVDIEEAKNKGLVAKDADPKKVMEDAITVIGNRIDPSGVREASITQAGEDRILIELPGMSPEEAAQIEDLIQDLGTLEMRLVAYEDNPHASFDLNEEKKRLDKWLDANKDLVEQDPQAILRFNQKAGKEGGPKSKWLRWYPMYRQRNPNWSEGSNVPKWIWEEHSLAHRHYLPINVHPEEPYFTGEDLDPKGIVPTQDRTGGPAVGYEIVPAKAGKYADWSERNIKKCSAIILNGYVRLAPEFQSRISGRGMISGRFTAQEVDKLIITLKTGSLDVLPELQSKSSIGATLGMDAIERGSTSIALSGLLIVLFMLIYYRIAGVVAVLSLVVNVFLVLGGMSFMRATLTLPGLAGIVLTIGMAVDANILIFERIREELTAGKDLKRAVEAGFEKALSTILDANITTFLTGMILYNVGIGPIRGFAVTLMLGIATSVFTALYAGKLVFHFLLAGEKLKKLTMARLFTQPRFSLLSLRKLTTPLSVLMVAGGLYVFFSTPRADKYGLDFTGGAAVRVALKTPMTQADFLKALRKDERFSSRFPSPMVTTIGEAGKDGKAREFSVKLKLTSEQRDAFAEAQRKARKEGKTYVLPYLEEMRRILGDKLAFDPFGEIKVTPDPEGGVTLVEAVIHSRAPLDIEEVEKRLGRYNVAGVKVLGKDMKPLADAKQGKNILIELDMPPNTSKAQVPLRLRDALKGMKDVNGEAVVLSSPFPEDSLIGPRAVGELISSAISAIIFSLFLVVMYIRVRFHEFKYGLAACVALVHDVSITLGAVVLFHQLGLIYAELDLSMIAAFLTIIGYSLNDTIVVFDRIRENLHLQKRMGGKESFETLVDRSVNQTLSRTVLTSLTTFVVVGCQFIFNHGAGSVLEGFSFSMMIGIIIGTYSSIWVANPFVVWLTYREERRGGSAGGKIEKVAAAG